MKNKSWRETKYFDDNGCLVSLNTKNHDGYTRVRCNKHKKLRMAHVIMWEEVYGEIPEGKEVNHKCGNRACFNVDHLELLDGGHHATHTNNSRVGYRKACTPVEDLMVFYYMVKACKIAINEVVRLFGIKRSSLSSIINKRSRATETGWIDDYISMEQSLCTSST